MGRLWLSCLSNSCCPQANGYIGEFVPQWTIENRSLTYYSDRLRAAHISMYGTFLHLFLFQHSLFEKNQLESGLRHLLGCVFRCTFIRYPECRVPARTMFSFGVSIHIRETSLHPILLFSVQI